MGEDGAFSLGVFVGIIIVIILVAVSNVPDVYDCVRAQIDGNNVLLWDENYWKDGGCMVQSEIDGNITLLTVSDYEDIIGK